MADSFKGMPRGIEVLIKKASVDTAFRELLVNKRAAAAAEIGLELSPSEIAVLNSLPQPQIEQIIDHTTLPDEHRRVFLGKIAAAMLALIALPVPTSAWEFAMTGMTVYERGGGSRSELPRPPGPTLKWPIEVRPVPREFELLDVEIKNQGENTLTVKVNYACPFDTAEIAIICGRGQEQAGTVATCRPESISATKGRGEAVFSVEGKGGATQGILVRLHSTAERSEKALSGYMTQTEFEAALLSFRSGEYQVEDSAIYKVVEFHKVWPS